MAVRTYNVILKKPVNPGGGNVDNDMYRIILDVLLKYIDEGIHIVDQNGKTVIYNEAMEKLEGLKKDDVLGRKLLDVFPSLSESTSTLLRALEEKAPIIDRYQTYMNKGGHKIATLNSTIPLMSGSGIIGALEISKDYTGLKSMYEKISLLQQELFKDNDVQKENKHRLYEFSDLIGYSREFLNTISMAKKAASSLSAVLVYGETGTGKELIAQAIHSYSVRKDKPFIAQNCAAIPEGLLESLLFGTVKGSFTGAVNRPGLFEQADGGTLMLDEINSMDIKLQSKLLRVIQEGYVRRVGGLNDIPIDVRIIATTNELPSRAIEEGNLRSDLYYRLSVININLPPLRQRREDIPLLVSHFINQYNRLLSKDIWHVSEDVEEALISYTWPGNVRELKNYIEGAMNLASNGHVIAREHFSPYVQSIIFKDNLMGYASYDLQGGLQEIIDSAEKKIITEALEKSGGNISQCARALKIKRQTLQHKMKKYNIILQTNLQHAK
jgi:arginine utilization regulatory protein